MLETSRWTGSCLLSSCSGPQKFPWWFTAAPLIFDSEVEFQFAITVSCFHFHALSFFFEDRNFSQPIRWEMVAFQRRLKKAPQRKEREDLTKSYHESDLSCEGRAGVGRDLQS